jgi:hypothetical protein
VARYPEDSRLGTSAFLKSKGARRNNEVLSCDGSHGGEAEDDMWHRASAFGVLKGECLTTFHMPISR